MEKRGVINEETPPENRPQNRPDSTSKPVATKQAADDVESHPLKRAADAVADTAATREG